MKQAQDADGRRRTGSGFPRSEGRGSIEAALARPEQIQATRFPRSEGRGKQVIGAQARLGQGTGAAYRLVRELVPFIDADTVLYPYMEAVYRVVAEGSLVAAVNGAMHEVDTQENIL